MTTTRGSTISYGSATRHTASVLLVETGDTPAHNVAAALVDAGYRIAKRVPATADLAAEAGRVRPDAIVLCSAAGNARRAAETLAKLAALESTTACPVVFAAAEVAPDTTHHAIDTGVSAFLLGEVDAARVRGVVELAVARFAELEGLRRELQSTRKKLAERKVIEKAKGLLMQRSGLDEDTAYRSLRKLAMDRNLTLVDVAENLLAVANVLDVGTDDPPPGRQPRAAETAVTPACAAPRAE